MITGRALWRPSIVCSATWHVRARQTALDTAVRAAYGMKESEDTLAFLLALNLELANEEANGVQLTPPGLPVSADEPAEFMSKDCVTVPEIEGDR